MHTSNKIRPAKRKRDSYHLNYDSPTKAPKATASQLTTKIVSSITSSLKPNDANDWSRLLNTSSAELAIVNHLLSEDQKNFAPPDLLKVILANSTSLMSNAVDAIEVSSSKPTLMLSSQKTINKRPVTPAASLWQPVLVNALTTRRPYLASRDCGIRALNDDRSQASQLNLNLNNVTKWRAGRVVGGRDSQFGEFPWTVMIRESTLLGLFYRTKCGGVLIDPKWVLTAAHCQPSLFGSLLVVIGEHNLHAKSNSERSRHSNSKLRPEVRRVRRMIVHRSYNNVNFDNDIALLELESPFLLEPHVVPICMPNIDEEFSNSHALVAGWGKLSYNANELPNVLQVAKLPIIDNRKCQEMYSENGHIKIISDSFLCAGYKDGGRDSCDGDSGSPLQVQRNDGRWVLAGTVSHGIKCAEPNLPGIYVRTAAYLPWIKAVLHHQDVNRRYGPSLQTTMSR